MKKSMEKKKEKALPLGANKPYVSGPATPPLPKEKIYNQKKAWRLCMQEKRSMLSSKRNSLLSQEIQRVACGLLPYKNSTGLHCFLSLKKETNTSYILKHAWREGKKVFIPYQENKTLGWARHFPHSVTLKGPKGVPEPAESLRFLEKKGALEIDLVLVPGLAFDLQGGRLGYGMGFYDSFLSRLAKERKDMGLEAPLAFGLCFSFQVVPHLPQDETDMPLDGIVTEKGFQEVVG